MRESDRQLGKPVRLYRNTKANIEALGLGAVDEGCVAYATDTNEPGAFDGAAWAWNDHNLLGPRHSDAATDAVTRGSIIVGSAIPAWDELPIGGAHQILKVTAGATDPVWASFAWDDIAAGAAADMVHDHSAAGEGGTLDWDNVWADAVHDHSANNEGGTTLGFTAMTGAGVDVPDGWYLGIGAGLERIVFDTAGDICVMGAKFGVGVSDPDAPVEISDSAAVLLHLHETDGFTGVARFTNTDDTAGWYIGISSQEKFGISRTLDINAGAEFVITQAGRIGCQVPAPAGQFHIDQPGTAAAIPVLVLDQGDTSEGVINFIALARGVILEELDSVESVRVELNGTVYRLALYVDA